MSVDRLRLPLVVVLLVVAGACGSSSGNSASSNPTTTAATAAGPTTTTPPTTTAPVPAQQNQSGTGAVAIQNFAFNPNQLNTTVGTKVTATNKDSFDHTWTADDGTWDSGHISGGQSYSFTFAKAGTFA